MRAVKGKNGVLSILTRDETALFNNIDFAGFTDISTLNERDAYVAEQMYVKNVLQKVKKGERFGYKTYQQKEQI